jgi:hypothetical protein
MPPLAAISRRRALRLAIGAGTGLVVAHRAVRRAGAYRGWCRSDPTIRIEGAVVHLWVSGRLDEAYGVAGPTRVVFWVPPGTACELLEQDAGFGQGYEITYAEDDKLDAKHNKREIAADVYVPTTDAGSSQPILVEWIPDGTVKRADTRRGKTNEWITAATKIKLRK